MLICSGTMPTFEPLTTKQTNLALCSTIQTGFIDRRIAATRSSSGSSRAGINAAGVAPGARGHPRRGGPARGCCALAAAAENSRARGQHRRRSGWWCLQSPSSSESPVATALHGFGAPAAEPKPSVWVLLSFCCPRQLLQNDLRTL